MDKVLSTHKSSSDILNKIKQLLIYLLLIPLKFHWIKAHHNQDSKTVMEEVNIDMDIQDKKYD